jgi:hypothetical protein
MASTIDSNKDFLGSVQMEVESLIQGRQIGDPRLYDAILLLNQQLERITQELSPLVKRSINIERGISELPAPGSFTCFSTHIGLRFTWDQVTYASQYEVRQGTNWDTALFRFRTTGLQGNIDPLLYGSYTFLIKTVDSQGNYSPTANSTTFEVPVIPAPAVTASVIDNNVLLSWTEPASVFKIDYYLVEKHGSSETSGRVDGTFTSIFEVVAGSYDYCVTTVDIAGNHGAEAEIVVDVSTPPDYALQSTRISSLNGTRDHVFRLPERPSLLCCVVTPQTWHEHYRVANNWMRPKDQVDAGYPIYIQPTNVTGWYEEIIDYGVIINNVIATITWNTIVYVPIFSVNVVVKMRVATTMTAGTPDWIGGYTTGASQYFRAVRYLQLRLEFTAENNKALIELYNLTTSLAAKRENDGGEVNALSTDAGGTTVNFTKPFKDIESLTCTTKSTTEPFIVIFDFNDIPNPTFFKVFVFDTMGARVTKIVDWKARGIV